MNRIYCLILLCVICCCCNNDDNNPYDSANIAETLQANSWKSTYVTTNEYSFGVELAQEIFTLYFFSDGSGLEYQVFQTEDTDGDKNRTTYDVPFTYNIDGANVILKYDNYISEFLFSPQALLYSGDSNHMIYTPSAMSSSDYEFIKGLKPLTGKCGDNLSWSYDKKTNQLTIQGTGNMYDYTEQTTPWKDCYITDIEITEGITSIGSWAFGTTSFSPLGEVRLPETLKTIGDCAFTGTLISEIEIPRAVTHIGKSAFAGCKYLKSLSFDGEYSGDYDLESIDDYAFDETQIQKYSWTFGKKLKRIGVWAFMGCDIKHIVMNEGLEEVGRGAFCSCSLTGSVEVPNTVTGIGDGFTFQGSFNKIVIGSGIKTLGRSAFLSTATSGEMYMKSQTPPSVDGDIITGNTGGAAESRWTLYVPTGCKTAYASKTPWKNFKSIIENNSL